MNSYINSWFWIFILRITWRLYEIVNTRNVFFSFTMAQHLQLRSLVCVCISFVICHVFTYFSASLHFLNLIDAVFGQDSTYLLRLNFFVKFRTLFQTRMQLTKWDGKLFKCKIEFTLFYRWFEIYLFFATKKYFILNGLN